MKNENNINVRNANRMPLWVRRTALSLCAAALLCSVPHVQAEEAAQAPKHKITFAVTCTRVGSGTLTTTAYSTGNNVSPAKHNVRLEIPYESAVSTPVASLITIERTPSQPVTEHRYVECDEDM